MKIIFLDIDGVIVTGKSFNDNCEVDSNCVYWLNRLTEETGAVLVLSSSRRKSRSFGECVQLLQNWGITGRLMSKTRILDDNHERGDEIRLWMETFPGEYSFIIIDDSENMKDLESRRIRTTWENGFTENEYLQAREILEARNC
jgi:HAD domain in Swiss Army Knife RNA repair proteins